MTFTLTHTRLLVSDYRACFRFYRDVLGLEPTWGDEESHYADFRTGDVTFALFDHEAMATAIDADTTARGRDTVAMIFGVEDVDAAYDDLSDQGVEFVAEPEDRADWGIRTAQFRDPDGNLVEINTSLDAV